MRTVVRNPIYLESKRYEHQLFQSIWIDDMEISLVTIVMKMIVELQNRMDGQQRQIFR